MIQRSFRESKNRMCSSSKKGVLSNIKGATISSSPFLSGTSFFITASFLPVHSHPSFSLSRSLLFHLHLGQGLVPPFKCFPINLPRKAWPESWCHCSTRKESDWLSLSHVFNADPINCAWSKAVPSAGVEEITQWEGGRWRWRQSDSRHWD